MDLRPLTLLAVAACGFTPNTVSGDDDDDVTNIVDDTAAELGGVVEGGIVAPRGGIEPHTYVTGGLHATGYKVNAVTTTSTYADLVAALPPASGDAYGYGLADW